MHEGTQYGSQTHSQFDVRESDAYAPTMDCKIKAPPSAGRMWLVALGFCLTSSATVAGAPRQFSNEFNRPSAVASRTVSSHDPSR
jgi:hypothetical protein